MNGSSLHHIFRSTLRQANLLKANTLHLLLPAGYSPGLLYGLPPGNHELELSLCRLPLRPGDMARGLFRRRNRVEKPVEEDTCYSIVETLSRKHLERFIRDVGGAEGPVRFPAQASLCIGDELVREPVVAEMEVRNNTGRVTLHHSRKIASGLPATFDTRTCLMKTSAEALVIIGKSAMCKEFVLWIKKAKP